MNVPMIRFILAALIAAALTAPASADSEAPNVARVVAGDPLGFCYSRSVPSDTYEQEGTTQVYQVTDGEADALLHSYDWYSMQIYLYCRLGGDMGGTIAMVRRGKWARGHEANDEELLLEFYYGGEKVARYSTLDIAGSPENVQASVSHYQVIEEVIGFDTPDTFTIRTVDGRTLVFDVHTGAMQ